MKLELVSNDADCKLEGDLGDGWTCPDLVSMPFFGHRRRLQWSLQGARRFRADQKKSLKNSSATEVAGGRLAASGRAPMPAGY